MCRTRGAATTPAVAFVAEPTNDMDAMGDRRIRAGYHGCFLGRRSRGSRHRGTDDLKVGGAGDAAWEGKA